MNLLEDFKTYILGNLSLQVNILSFTKKQEEECATLAIFCSRCWKKHPRKDCPLDNIFICTPCVEDESRDSCPSLPGLKVEYHKDEQTIEQIYWLATKRLWKPRPQGTYFNFLLWIFQNFLIQNTHLGVVNAPWQMWSQHPLQNHPWQKVWWGLGYGPMPPYPYLPQCQYPPQSQPFLQSSETPTSTQKQPLNTQL